MDYRLYRPEDFPHLYAIEQECFQPPFRFPRRYMQQLVGSPNVATWISEEDRQMTGFAIVNWAQQDKQTHAYIQTLEVAPAHRKRGIATELLHRLESSARTAGATSINLHVAESNTPAIYIYKAHGYQPRDKEEDYYAPGIDALVFAKPLLQPL